jgi:DNA mismatch repair protein MutL
MAKLNHLSQELINQIAAGEVVERPASVVKELIDNSIDANASKIIVRVKNGGIDLIEISDNGVGIEKENLNDIFLPHTTTKIASLSDLEQISTMGFRGEALSTIQSVAKVSIISKYKDEESAYSIELNNSKEISKGARDDGTTITIKELFYNTPARLKFVKSEQTEYRKILDVVINYSLSFPSIHFILEKDGRQILNLPSSDLKSRLSQIVKKEYVSRMIEIKSEGAGVKIYGLVGHPTDGVVKTSEQYIFVNKRPIWDNGIAKSVHMGLSRFMPVQTKVPFVVFVDLENSMVDVNVHPRKEEVRFVNPYRIYSAVEQAVTASIQTQTSNQYTNSNNQPSVMFDRSNIKYTPDNSIKEIKFDKKPSDFNITKSINFSKQVLHTQPTFNFNEQEPLTRIENSFEQPRNIFQVFNKYIVIEFEDTLWMMDQHAAAERINFEKLSKQYSGDINEVQRMLVPISISVSETEKDFLIEYLEFFKKLGFEIELDENRINILTVPSYIVHEDIEKVFRSLFDVKDEIGDISSNFEKKKEDILATMSCHSSVRAGQRLSPQECLNIYNELGRCANPYSCPHGRPAVWKLKLTDIDTNFFRTY